MDLFSSRRSLSLSFVRSCYGAMKLYEIFFEVSMALIIGLSSEVVRAATEFEGKFWTMGLFIAMFICNVVQVSGRIVFKVNLRLLIVIDLILVTASLLLSYVLYLQVTTNKNHPEVLLLYMPLPCAFPQTVSIHLAVKRLAEKKKEMEAIAAAKISNFRLGMVGESLLKPKDTSYSSVKTYPSNLISNQRYISKHLRTLAPASISCPSVTATIGERTFSPVFGRKAKRPRSILKTTPTKSDSESVSSPRKVLINVPVIKREWQREPGFREYKNRSKQTLSMLELPNRKFSFDVRTERGSVATLMKEVCQISSDSVKLTTVIEMLTYDNLHIIRTKETFVNSVGEVNDADEEEFDAAYEEELNSADEGGATAF